MYCHFLYVNYLIDPCFYTILNETTESIERNMSLKILEKGSLKLGFVCGGEVSNVSLQIQLFLNACLGVRDRRMYEFY